MKVNVKEITGVWVLGYSLDKHVIRSVPIGPNQFGHMQFDTERSEAGESLYQLKYRNDYSQVPIIAQQMVTSFSKVFSSINLVVPMPPSKVRPKQPVVEIAQEYARLIDIPCHEDLLVKISDTPPMKDIAIREEKISTLMGAFTVYDVLKDNEYNVLIIDDLYDSGSSLEAATNMLKGYNKIRNIFVATVTRKR